MKQTTTSGLVCEPIASTTKRGELRAYVRLLIDGKPQRVSGDWFRVELLSAILANAGAVQAAIDQAETKRVSKAGSAPAPTEPTPPAKPAPTADVSQLAELLGALGFDPAALAMLQAGNGATAKVSSGTEKKPANLRLADKVRARSR